MKLPDSSTILALSCASLVFFGLGCEPPSTPATTAGPDVTASLTLSPQDRIELSHTILGVGGKIARSMTEAWKGTRTLTLTTFEPGSRAELSWETAVERETDASKRARATFQLDQVKGKTSPTSTIPEPVMERLVTSGTIDGVNLSATHTLTPPTFWKPTDAHFVGESSAIWLSTDAFEELSRTGKTTLNLGFLESSANQILANLNEVRSFISSLKKETVRVQDKIDPTLMTRDGGVTMRSLLVNGKEVQVQAIKAHSALGEILVLNNKNNPLVLELTFNPLLTGAAELSSKEQGMAGLLGFQVTSLTLKNIQ